MKCKNNIQNDKFYLGFVAYNATAAAFETLSDPKAAAYFIFTSSSHVYLVNSRKPGPSAPSTIAKGLLILSSTISSMLFSAVPSRPTT